MPQEVRHLQVHEGLFTAGASVARLLRDALDKEIAAGRRIVTVVPCPTTLPAGVHEFLVVVEE